MSLRWSDPVANGPAEIGARHPARGPRDNFRSTDSTFKLDAIVAATAERFRGSRWGETYDLGQVARLADQVSEELPQNEEVHDFLELLGRAADIER